MVRRAAVIGLMTATLTIAWIGPAGASCIGYRDPEAEFRQALTTAPIAFVGDIVATSDRNRTAEVAIVEIWHGPALPSRVVVHGSVESDPNVYTSNDRYFTAGMRLLFLPSDERPPFTDHACSFTREYTVAVSKLRPTEITSPAPSTVPDPVDGTRPASSSSWPAVLAVFGGVALVTVLAAGLRSRALRMGR